MRERRSQDPPQSLLEYLERLPASVLLARLNVPVLGVRSDGEIYCANPAFEAMLGVPVDGLRDMPLHELFDSARDGAPAVQVVRGHIGKILRLRHRDDTVVQVIVSDAGRLDTADPIALFAFHDVTDFVWEHGRSAAEQS